MKHYGLIGFPLSHSFSKKYFTDKFAAEGITDCTYELYPIESIEDLPKLLHQYPDLCGLNVTIPHKVKVIKQLDWVKHDAKGAGAVNCIRITSESPVLAAFSGEVGVQGHDFRLEGYNTDIYGFDMSLTPLLEDHHDSALILGDGGAARAVKCVLDNKGISYKCVTRKPAEGNLLFSRLTAKDIKNTKLIINTTPVGTYPDVNECPPIPYEAITDEHLLFDLIYNPDKTLFLKKGEEQGATIKNGYEMLVLQAEKAWEIWNSKEKHP
ncbi:shikimate dehydrogenase family protein [Mucilaginibacter phyllosphaerae]|uniref:Shikimate dehydrogenase n=1 Tax=Mucilaginibacter phyllosphaerae TaxID=1812349 RepID=A0A4Y8ADA5_9SPHI|nr:shikimate dehydrogenase [Mucilaginibacter phyllosphaerae]MBB3970255.1 shikimate dehydrogenase [Mucilaginibacter phyllosphaerae]TEW66634.1 shikimate dehydrogenase [Mucilaginibacter phyllosphaerae]GGH10844.1 shikimate 5-dehydrogenase [Mucilaginibacter phyllosphaerae]